MVGEPGAIVAIDIGRLKKCVTGLKYFLDIGGSLWSILISILVSQSTGVPSYPSMNRIGICHSIGLLT